VRRRDALGMLAAMAAGVGSTRAQQPGLRRIGYLSGRSAGVEQQAMALFRQGLNQTGHVEGKNLAIEDRWADGEYDRLPALARDLVSRQVAVIATSGGPQLVREVRAASPTIPIVFLSGGDPVLDGLVGSLAHPGGNTTGISTFTTLLGPKRLELLRELVPGVAVFGFLVNASSQTAAMQIAEIKDAAGAAGIRIEVLAASSGDELERAFGTLAARGIGALLIGADLFFQVERDRLIALSSRHRMPTMFEWPEFVAAGGLISYAPVRTETWLQWGIYVGRILNGEDPATLPVMRATRFELTINLKTARALGLRVPDAMLARADEVIE
jgi:putative ABC transport system substrate-binding protein